MFINMKITKFNTHFSIFDRTTDKTGILNLKTI